VDSPTRGPEPLPHPGGDAAVGGSPGVTCWGPARWIAIVTALAGAACLVWCALDRDPENRLVAAVLTACGVIVTVLLVRIRVRLRLVPDGIVVTGPLRSTEVPYAHIVTIATPTRGRFGRRAVVLELEVHAPGTDPADDQLILFGRFDLDADPAAVGRELRRRWAAETRP
jgi:hypothetical protein